MTSNDDYILEILENVGLVSREQAVAARQIATQEDEGVMDVLAREGVVSKLDMLKALKAMGKTILVSSHYLDENLLSNHRT